MVISRSPGGLSGRGRLPPPVTSRVAPWSMPGGKVTLSRCVELTSPEPRQARQASFTMRPVDLHRAHGRSTEMGKSPCWTRTLPRPAQDGQMSGVEPGAEPFPLQSPHGPTRG